MLPNSSPQLANLLAMRNYGGGAPVRPVGPAFPVMPGGGEMPGGGGMWGGQPPMGGPSPSPTPYPVGPAPARGGPQFPVQVPNLPAPQFGQNSGGVPGLQNLMALRQLLGY